MNDSAVKIKDSIIHAALPDVVFDGWTMDVIKNAALKGGNDVQAVHALFPTGMADVLAHYADLNDRLMLEKLEGVNAAEMRIRDKIHMAVMTRLEIVSENRDAEAQALAFWSLPTRSMRASKVLWRTADAIWNWAGDTATDYNHYTKRGLLSGVIGSTMLYWMSDAQPDDDAVSAFVSRRIENVMQLGGILGKIKKAS
ncbi:MAG TPA: COQ9 family protein [Micavibrio sp.]|nr:COQ9 family protein [Micavibrio sp.]HIL29535.1 COQ9 family protein [Micavibrio sp.]